MRLHRSVPALRLMGEDNVSLIVLADNRGEPYRDGVTLSVDDPGTYDNITSIFLENHEARALRDKLIEMFPL